MTSFVISGTGTVAQVLTSGQNGFVTNFGTLYTESAVAVTMSGNTDLTVMGSVASSGGNAVLFSGFTANSVIQVGAAGSILSNATTAIVGAYGPQLDVINGGTISGLTAINVSSANTSGNFFLDNSGRIEGFGGNGNSAIIVGLAGAAQATISNSGTIIANDSLTATISLTSFNNLALTNTGTIEGSLGGLAVNSAGSLSLHNSGDIIGDIKASAFTSITNSGTIDGTILLSIGDDSVTNSGVIHGSVALGDGSNTYTSHGGVVDVAVNGGSGSDFYIVDQTGMKINDTGGFDTINTTVNFQMAPGIEVMNLIGALGLVGTGSDTNNEILGNVGNDTLLGRGGADALFGGDGDNVLRGGLGDDDLFGGADNDLMAGGDGNDILVVGTGNDTLSGGAGTDTISISGLSSDGNVVNLATKVVNFTGAGTITISGIEDVIGSGQADTITGDGGANRLVALNGADALFGGGGNDTLVGGGGADTMNGGPGSDVFQFTAVSESNASGGIDQITGFALTGDVIDLSLIDANLGSVGDDSFVFVGTAAFSGTGPQVRFSEDTVAGTTTIEVRLAGSVADDMVIQLGTALALTVANFDL